MNVKLIAVNYGVDSDKGEDNFASFRNVMNEWYAKDMSHKTRSTQKTTKVMPLVSHHLVTKKIPIT